MSPGTGASGRSRRRESRTSGPPRVGRDGKSPGPQDLLRTSKNQRGRVPPSPPKQSTREDLQELTVPTPPLIDSVDLYI